MNALAAALVKAQAAMPAVEDNARANYGTYVTLDHLIAKTRNILNEHGLAIVQFPSVSELGAPTLRTILIHGESGERLEADCPLFLNGKNDMQALGGAITYARRYGWGAALGISTDQDDDGNAVSAVAENGSSSSDAPGRQGAPEPSPGNGAPAFPHPAGQLRSDAQGKLLHVLYKKLNEAGAITEEAFCNSAHQGGAQGTTAQACCETITKTGASELISKLKKLETNVQAAA